MKSKIKKAIWATLSIMMVMSFTMTSKATTTTEKTNNEFTRLDKNSSADLLSRANILLRQYGNPEEFKISQEVTSKDECQTSSRIRTKVICDKMAKVQTTTIFAEGNGLLCKISNQAQDIKCVEKK